MSECAVPPLTTSCVTPLTACPTVASSARDQTSQRSRCSPHPQVPASTICFQRKRTSPALKIPGTSPSRDETMVVPLRGAAAMYSTAVGSVVGATTYGGTGSATSRILRVASTPPVSIS